MKWNYLIFVYFIFIFPFIFYLLLHNFIMFSLNFPVLPTTFFFTFVYIDKIVNCWSHCSLLLRCYIFRIPLFKNFKPLKTKIMIKHDIVYDCSMIFLERENVKKSIMMMIWIIIILICLCANFSLLI